MNEKVSMVAKVLLIIGGLNWGLVAISPKAELVQYLQVSWLIKIVYALVGISALIAIAEFKK
jgi:uncharacterized membrane protein YuzA (DUF378 family)